MHGLEFKSFIISAVIIAILTWHMNDVFDPRQQDTPKYHTSTYLGLGYWQRSPRRSWRSWWGRGRRGGWWTLLWSGLPSIARDLGFCQVKNYDTTLRQCRMQQHKLFRSLSISRVPRPDTAVTYISQRGENLIIFFIPCHLGTVGVGIFHILVVCCQMRPNNSRRWKKSQHSTIVKYT